MAKPTWEMSSEELARVVAEQRGWSGDRAGYIRTRSFRPVAHGYGKLGNKLVKLGAIVPGRGIDWMRVRELRCSAVQRLKV